METIKDVEKVDDTTVDAVPATETTEATTSPETTTAEETQTVDEKDLYIAELEKDKAKIADKLKKAEFKLTQKDIASRSQKKTSTEDAEATTTDAPVSQDEVVSKAVEILRKEQAQSLVELELSKIENAAERELTLHYYNTKLVKSGYGAADIQEDLSTARFLANKAKYDRRASEIKSAVAASKTKSTDAPLAGQGSDAQKPITLSPIEQQLLSRAGVKPEDVGKDVQQLINNKKK